MCTVLYRYSIQAAQSLAIAGTRPSKTLGIEKLGDAYNTQHIIFSSRRKCSSYKDHRFLDIDQMSQKRGGKGH